MILDNYEIEQATKEEMEALMVKWAILHPKKNESYETGADGALVDLCRDALYRIGRDDCGGCVMCRS